MIAGSGEFPFWVLDEIRKQGRNPVVAGIRGEADLNLEKKSGVFEWFDVGNIRDLVSFFNKNDIQEAVFAGKVNPQVIFRKNRFDKTSQEILNLAQARSPAALIQKIIDFMKKEGIKILNPRQFIVPLVCDEGILTGTEVSADVEENVAFGWEIARRMADLDIGQTVVVKDKAVVAVEGIEGTDEAIKRGGQLAGKDTVVVKVCRTRQDPRVDLPAVGLDTVQSLIEAQARALCFEAQCIPFFRKEEAVALADSQGIAIMVRKG